MTMNDRKKSALCYLMIGLMLFSTTAAAANVSTFADSSLSVEVDIRNPSNYEDLMSGAISLPEGETITSAQMNISTTMATHADYTTYDQSVMPSGAGGIWDARYNSGLTTYSDANCHASNPIDCSFTSTSPGLALTSKGFNADFEIGDQGMVPGSPIGINNNNWERMTQGLAPVIASGCYSGDYCWGTNFLDMDYTDDDPAVNSFEYTLETSPIWVYPGKGTVSFASYHSLYHRSASGANNYYYDDCAYVAARNSSDMNAWSPWQYVPFDINSVTGFTPGSNGMFQKWNGQGANVNKVQNQCNGKGAYTVPDNAWVLSGQSTHSNNLNGWATLGLDVSSHEGKYLELLFVLEKNPQTGAAVNGSMPGWYIDALRVGDPLPQAGNVVMKSFTPVKPPNPGFPDGYGILDVEVASAGTNAFTVDILDASNGQLVIDDDGNTMSGLTGDVIELWGIDAATYGLIDLRFNYNTGPSRLTSPVVYGFSVGTRIGTGLNSSAGTFSDGGTFSNGSWTSGPQGGMLLYQPTMNDFSWTPYIEKNRFSMPVVAIKPMVHDSCGPGSRTLMVGGTSEGSGSLSPVNNQWATLTAPSPGIGIGISYSGPCTVYGIWLDVKFGHSLSNISLDVAADGDVEWGFAEPAFGGFGRQQSFRTHMSDDINYGADSMQISMNINGIGEGATFLLPKGAQVSHAEASFDYSTVGNASISLVAGPSEIALGYTEGKTRLTPETWNNSLSVLKDEIQQLLDDPNVPSSHTDAYGNEFVLFRFRIENPTAQAGTNLLMRDLDIIYTWSTTLSDSNDFARELNQGIALGTPMGGQVAVPVKVTSDTGGALTLDALSVTTESGYHSSMNTTGEWTGLYADGEVYEVVSSHSVDASTGATISGASLQFESESGVDEIRWTSSNDSFWPAVGGDGLVSLMAAQSNSAVGGSGDLDITWRFRVNSAWQDSASARVFATLITDTGAEGLPAAVLLNPTVGNAIENDAGITALVVYNQAGEAQNDLSHMDSNQVITLEGTVRLEDLQVAPDPASYSLVFEQQNASNLSDWNEIDRIPGPVGGNFSWQPGIDELAAGNDTYRLRFAEYTGGDTICPPSQLNPDLDCAIVMTLFIDSYSPYLINISVDDIQSWRDLQDDTWIPPKANQKFRVIVRDIPTTPDSLTLNYWVEAQHDANNNRIPEPSEYRAVPMMPDSTDVNGNTTYFISNIDCPPTSDCIDDRQQGITIPSGDPAPRTSLYLTGTDQSGNPVGGGAPGFINDLITYIGKESRAPGVYSFHINDAFGNPLTEFNKSMYAGNVYHMLVDGKDENGWRDVEYIKIDLNPIIAGDMIIFYGPRNGTAWTDSTWVDLLQLEVDGVGPRLTRLNGNALIDPFEVEFLLDLPIRLHWSLTTVQGVVNPEIYMKDLDPENDEARLSSSRYKQNWAYSSGVKFDRQTLDISDTSGYITNSVGTQDGGFVRPGDLLRLQGEYRFKDALQAGIDVKPEITMTLVLVRTPLYPGGESDRPGSGYVAASEETFEYEFDNGTFDLIIPAALSTNEYRYVWTLCVTGCDVVLPAGATDATIQDDRTFYVKVDNEPPKVVWGSWSMQSGSTGDDFTAILPSSSIHCVNLNFAVEERQKLESDSIEINWMFFKNSMNWSEYKSTYPDPWQTSVLDVDLGASPNRASGSCLDLWPDHELPSDLEGVDLIFWVTGKDSAGNGVSLAGQFGSAVQGGEYALKYQEAEYRVDSVVISPSQPEATKGFELIITVTNTGTESGTPELQLFTIIDGRQTGNVNHTCEKIWTPNMKDICRVPIQAFPEAVTGVQIKIHDADGNLLGETEPFHIRAVGTGEKGESNLMLYASVGIGIIVVVAVAVAALMLLGKGREEEDEDQFFIEDEDFLPAGEAVEPLPRTHVQPRAAAADAGDYATAGSTPPGYGGGGPPGGGESQMDRAKRLFPHWDEATIQGYFDQGWTIAQLQDWVQGNK
jgi:hypothetical protein